MNLLGSVVFHSIIISASALQVQYRVSPGFTNNLLLNSVEEPLEIYYGNTDVIDCRCSRCLRRACSASCSTRYGS